MLNGGLHPRHLTPKRVSIEGSFLFLLRWSTIFCIAVLVRWKNYSKKRCDDSFLNSSFLSSFELIDHDNNFGKNFSKLFPSERTIKFLPRRLSIGRDGSFRIRSMFHFVHVNESIEVFFRFMNHPLPSLPIPPLSFDPPNGKKFPSLWIGDGSFETSISEIENFRLVVVH